MGKFTIIDKDKSGNKGGERYTITYQIESRGSERFKVDMYCVFTEPVRYCYIADQYGVGLETEKDRAEFLDEFYEFQKGGSYRKTHPIKYKKSELIKEQIKQQEDNLYQLKRDLEKAEKEEKEEAFKTYYDKVDMNKLEKYVERIKEAFNDDRYYVDGIEFHIWEGHRIFIYDRKLNKRVKVITIQNGQVKFRNLDKDDMH